MTIPSSLGDNFKNLLYLNFDLIVKIDPLF